MIVFNNHTSGLTEVHYQGHSIKEVHNALGKVWPDETPPTPTGYSSQYLTFVAEEDGTFSFVINGGYSFRVYYSLDSGTTWTDGRSVSVQSGQTVMWKGNMLNASPSPSSKYFSSTCRFYVEGNVMSLLYDDNFIGQTNLNNNNYIFDSLFADCNKLTSAENLILPSTTLTYGCYQTMFQRCTSLTTAPSILPATTLDIQCYNYMFDGCTSLTTAPELLATTLVEGCYSHMFNGCTSLTTAPVLSATTLSNRCYWYMFYNCTNLNYIKCLATDISATNCTYNWLLYVASNGTFVKNPSMNDWTSGSSGIPNGWTVVDNT